MTRPMAPGLTVEPRSVVWIDSERAVLVRWDGEAHLARLHSDVPPHFRGVGHVTHDSELRAMGSPTTEQHHEEHLRHFVREVAARVDPRYPVEVLGPGPVRRRLAEMLISEDRHHHRTREVTTRAAGLTSEAQLIARARETAGDPAPRRRTGGGAA